MRHTDHTRMPSRLQFDPLVLGTDWRINMQHSPIVALSIVSLGISVFGCGGSEVDERGQRVSVVGEVVLDGKPLSNARIVFISDEGAGAVKATALIENGAYSIDEANGPLTGNARVEIHPELMELESLEAAKGGDRYKQVETKPVNIPARYNSRTELSAPLALEGDNTFDFELASK